MSLVLPFWFGVWIAFPGAMNRVVSHLPSSLEIEIRYQVHETSVPTSGGTTPTWRKVKIIFQDLDPGFTQHQEAERQASLPKPDTGKKWCKTQGLNTHTHTNTEYKPHGKSQLLRSRHIQIWFRNGLKFLHEIEMLNVWLRHYIFPFFLILSTHKDWLWIFFSLYKILNLHIGTRSMVTTQADNTMI